MPTQPNATQPNVTISFLHAASRLHQCYQNKEQKEGLTNVGLHSHFPLQCFFYFHLYLSDLSVRLIYIPFFFYKKNNNNNSNRTSIKA
jgi:hypothetical protein